MEFEKKIKEFINNESDFYSVIQIIKKLNLFEEFEESIKKLEKNGDIYYDEFTNKYGSMPSNFFVTEINSSKKGKKYIDVNGTKIMLSSENLKGAITFDKVIVSYDDYKYNVEKILSREKSSFMCELVIENGKKRVISLDKDVMQPIKMRKKELLDLNNGDIFLIDADTKITSEGIKGTFEKLICNKLDPDADIIAICYEYGFRVNFSDESLKELESIPETISENSNANRIDLRDELIYTIDGSETKDIDDAISITKTDFGYILKVHIAHVSAYVPLNSALFEDALKNTTSIYPPGKVIPMFPHKISSGICSLNEGVDRFARTTEMHFDNFGNIIESKTYKSIIHSRKKMTYENVNKILEEDIIPKGYIEFEENLRVAYKLSKLLNRIKLNRGYIKFLNEEVTFLYTNKGTIQEVVQRKSGVAQELIENFMVITNSTLTTLGPITYRNHEEPEREKVDNALKEIKQLDFTLPKSDSISTRNYLQIILDYLSKEEAAHILNKIILHSFNRAKYEVENKGHFGLALDNYAHTTSPIRRIIDFMNQVVLDMEENPNTTIEEKKEVYEKLKNICELASEKERYADTVEHKASLIEMARYLQDKIGEEYEMYLSEINPNYIKVSTKGMLEGIIPIEDFIGDTVHYTKKGNLKSDLNGWEYKVGNTLRVKLKSVQTSSGLINYTMEENLTRTKKIEEKKNSRKRKNIN